MVTIASLALVAAVSLVQLTSYLRKTTAEVAATHESIRLAQEIEVDVLTHARTGDARRRNNRETEIRANMKEMGEYVEGGKERDAFDRAAEKLNQYLQRASELPNAENLPELEDTFEALSELVEINIGQAERSDAQAARWNDIADTIGLAVAALLAIGVATTLAWVWIFAFKPVLEIRHAMKEFADGNRRSRAPLQGPEELRSIATQFNEMADAIAKQRENQFAFLAGIAHDLRNPISTLNMSARLLSPDEKLPPEDRLRTVLSIIERQIGRLNRMIDDLLDATRIEAGQLELRFEKVDARAIVRDVFELFETSSAKHELWLEVPSDEVPLQCDPLRIEQVLTNLVSNAVKYSPGGGRVVMALDHKRDEVLFRVSDCGLGIPAEELPHIFEPFRRSNSSKNSIAGVGLGLSVARRIVEAHHGRIHLSSTQGQGTVVEVNLPSKRAA
jgi:signal transduction histidine kinase